MFWTTLSLAVVAALALRTNESVPADPESAQSIEQLRHAIGLWSATTDSFVRTSQPFTTAAGGESQLRFTRSNVQLDSFESQMEYTEDGGQSWKPGNHQRFQRLR